MKALVISIVLAIAIVGCVPKVVLPKDLCVKYELAWHTSPAAIPTQTACVCTEDVYVGLDAILDTLVSFPDTITLKGIMAPSECKPDAEKVTVNDGDAEVKALLQ
jgi:hypothetical protein